jgi:mannose-1-phosphate guanylyltransferase
VNQQSSSSVCPGPGHLIVPVVLSGGGGTRLWPYSTNETPKQFLPLVGSKSLFRETLDRVADAGRFTCPIVVAGERHSDKCELELQGRGAGSRLILEPFPRNTAPAIALAAELVQSEHRDDALMLVMPSDHVIDDPEAFQAAVDAGRAAAEAGHLVTFGVRPTRADTGYGYIEIGSELGADSGAFEVARFVEKPQLASAEAMVAGGRHLWNAGIFLFRADNFLGELSKFAPGIAASAGRAVAAGTCEGIRVLPDRDALHDCPGQSVDYAVMEHSSQVAVVPMAAGWSDLGSWDALADLAPMDGDNDIVLIDCDNCYVRSDGFQVAALGVSDLIIVATEGGILILPRGRSQEVKRLLAKMNTDRASVSN